MGEPDRPRAYGIRCPRCHCTDLRVHTTRRLPGDQVRRYRQCRHCGRMVVTVEARPKSSY